MDGLAKRFLVRERPVLPNRPQTLPRQIQHTMKTSMIFGQLTIEDISTSSAEVFRANRSVRPDGERGRKITVTSSQRLSELLRKHDRSGSFLKTLLVCSPFSNPIVYLKWRSKRLSFFVRTVNDLQQAPSSDSNDGSSEASFQKSGQQDMYFRNSKTAHQSFCVFRLLPLALHTGRDRVWFVAHADRHRDQQPENEHTTSQGRTAAKGPEERQGQRRTGIPDGFSGLPYLAGHSDTAGGNGTGNAEPCPAAPAPGIAHSGADRWNDIPLWKEWPTESPFCGRDDGLSERLDGVTFPTWRAESIKAYGNAIVPQVALEIFRPIQAVTPNQKVS